MLIRYAGGEFYVVYQASSMPEAAIIVGRLESEEIPATIVHEPVGTAMGIQFGALGQIRVIVRESDHQRALAILDQIYVEDDEDDEEWAQLDE